MALGSKIERSYRIAAGALLLLAAAALSSAPGPQETPAKGDQAPAGTTTKAADNKAADKSRLSLEERMEIMEEELEKRKLRKAVKTYESVGGLGPAASGVYHTDSGLSWGGYGEVKYRDYRSDKKTDEADVHRLILYAGYRFNDWIVLNSEIEYEHAGFEKQTVVTDVDFTKRTTSKGSVNSGEVFVEFAYIDLKFADSLQLALGLNLVPMGITNYMHEPTTFYAVERPVTETNIIPSTWREIGAIFHGELFGKDLVYRTGVLNGQTATNFSSSSWIRGGRSQGSKAPANDLGYVANVEYKGIENLTVGTSFYTGKAGQNQVNDADFQSRFTMFPGSSSPDTTTVAGIYQSENTGKAPVRVNIAEAHFDYRGEAFSLRGLFARGWMNEDDTRAVNKVTGRNIGKVAEGAYLEAGYNIATFFGWKHKLYTFIRGEYVNTQKETVQRFYGGREDIEDLICSQVPGGFCRTTSGLPNGNRDLGVIAASDTTKELYGVKGVADRTNDRRIITVGVAYFPHPNVALKADYEQQSSKSDAFKDQEFFNSNNNKIDRMNLAVTFIF